MCAMTSHHQDNWSQIETALGAPEANDKTPGFTRRMTTFNTFLRKKPALNSAFHCFWNALHQQIGLRSDGKAHAHVLVTPAIQHSPIKSTSLTQFKDYQHGPQHSTAPIGELYSVVLGKEWGKPLIFRTPPAQHSSLILSQKNYFNLYVLSHTELV